MPPGRFAPPLRDECRFHHRSAVCPLSPPTVHQAGSAPAAAVHTIVVSWFVGSTRTRKQFVRHFNYLRAGGGGAEGNRTPDLLIANEALSQLSYSPALRGGE